MPFDESGDKWACEPCVRGHRSTKCSHFSRVMIRVKRPGRPLQSCPHGNRRNCPCKADKCFMVKIRTTPNGVCLCRIKVKANAAGQETGPTFDTGVVQKDGNLVPLNRSQPPQPQIMPGIKPEPVNGHTNGMMHGHSHPIMNGFPHHGPQLDYGPSSAVPHMPNGSSMVFDPSQQGSNYQTPGQIEYMPHGNGLAQGHNLQNPTMFMDGSQYMNETGSLHTNGNSHTNGMYNGISQQTQMPMNLSNGHDMGVEQALMSPHTTMTQNGDQTPMGYENETSNGMPMPPYSPQSSQGGNANGISAKNCNCGAGCNCVFCPDHPHNAASEMRMKELMGHMRQEMEEIELRDGQANSSPGEDVNSNAGVSPGSLDQTFEQQNYKYSDQFYGSGVGSGDGLQFDPDTFTDFDPTLLIDYNAEAQSGLRKIQQSPPPQEEYEGQGQSACCASKNHGAI